MWNRVESPGNIPRDVVSLNAVTKNKVKMLNKMLDQKQLRQAYMRGDSERLKNSLALEGTYLTDEDMATIYSGGVPKNIRSRDGLMEALNIKSATELIYELLDDGVGFSEDVMLRLHRVLATGLLDRHNTGSYRNCMVTIGRGMYQVAAINQTSKLMKQLFEVIEEIDYSPVRASFFSYTLVSIHPFKDYNGRLSRLCESYILMSQGYPPITIFSEERETYMTLIRDSQETGEMTSWGYTRLITNKVSEIVDNLLYCNPEYTNNAIE